MDISRPRTDETAQPIVQENTYLHPVTLCIRENPDLEQGNVQQNS